MGGTCGRGGQERHVGEIGRRGGGVMCLGCVHGSGWERHAGKVGGRDRWAGWQG